MRLTSFLIRSSNSSSAGRSPCIMRTRRSRSAPAQNASSPAPVKMAARTAGSPFTSSQASASRQSISALIALRTAGRFIVTTAIAPDFSYRTAGSALIADDPHREVLRASAVGVAERRPRAVHLMRAGAAHHLEGRLAEAQHAGSADRVRAQHAARWVDRQMRADLLLAAVDDLPALADVAEAQVLEPHRLEPSEGDVDLGGVDLLPRVRDARALVHRPGAHLPRLGAHLVAARYPHGLGIGGARPDPRRLPRPLARRLFRRDHQRAGAVGRRAGLAVADRVPEDG